MVPWRPVITGFNTDVQHDGKVYHVQTEDRGAKENPVLESLIYLGGTIIAKKRTEYGERLSQGATVEMIGSLLKKQHQVIIAAIKAGRIEDLVQYSTREHARPGLTKAPDIAIGSESVGPRRPRRPGSGPLAPPAAREAPLRRPTPQRETEPAAKADGKRRAVLQRGRSGSLNLDDVIAQYLKLGSQQARLDLTVLSPAAFVAGTSVGLRVQIADAGRPEADAVVTIKIIGTAFKPQVYIGRAGADGIANFSLPLPSFSAGTAAVVIEAQSGRGRGELKQLIRRG